MNIAKRPQALADLDAAADYLNEQVGEELAIRFLDAAEASLERAASMPASGAPFETSDPRLTGLRHASIRGFRNYFLFYLERADGIELVRVLHAKRDLESVLAD